VGRGGGTVPPVIARVSAYFRKRRMRWFLAHMRIGSDTRILDIGGSPSTWSGLPVQPQVTLLNIPMSLSDDSSARWVVGDGCALPFADHSYDIVFSNSVIEHVGAEAAQLAFALEARRVGRRGFIQTPNRGFPIEQHLMMPFVHWLPRSWQQAIVSRWTLWQFVARPRPDQREFYLRHYLQDIRLLNPARLQALFPQAVIRRERALGFTKSLIAIWD
jgi:SAM-dependent methyltransferase